MIRAEPARMALLDSAERLGVEIRAGEGVVAIGNGDAPEVRTTQRTLSCGRVVVAAGPWTPRLLAHIGIDLPLFVSSQSVAYFRPPPNAEKLPVVMEFDGDEAYSLMDPERGLKAALHRRGPEVEPDPPWDVVDSDALERIEAWVASRFVDVDRRPTHVEACLYTSTPDERFILERHGPVVVGSACSGQGFQFAPATGRPWRSWLWSRAARECG